MSKHPNILFLLTDQQRFDAEDPFHSMWSF
jgi:hypothetical protein